MPEGGGLSPSGRPRRQRQAPMSVSAMIVILSEVPNQQATYMVNIEQSERGLTLKLAYNRREKLPTQYDYPCSIVVLHD